MKIGVLTLPFNNNYGGYLQAYALMTVLKQEGHEVELIYRQHNKVKYPLSYYLKTMVKMILGRPHGPIIPTPDNWLRIKGKNLMPFVDKYISPRTKPLYSSEELEDAVLNGNYDIIITGSDQLWRPDYVPNIENFFLSFLRNSKTKVISYAASFGTDKPNYTDEQKKICDDAISRFKAISVREQSGIDVIKNFGWNTATEPVVVLDPTMLLPTEHYISLLPKTDSPSKGKIFCYVLDNSEEVKAKTNEFVSQLGKEKYEIADIQKTDADMPSIETWLSAIRDADFIITDSFHGTVFSIIFNKPFVSYANIDRGYDRFVTLLDQFNLMDRLNNYTNSPIDWKEVNHILINKQEVSKLYLQQNL